VAGASRGHDPHHTISSPRMSPRRRPARRRPHQPLPSPAAWIGARARNALRRPVFIGAVSIVTFVLSLLALVIVPQQARRAAAAIRPPAASRPDTEPTSAALREAERQIAAAESTIVAARAEIAKVVSATAQANAADTLAGGVPIGAGLRTRRDSLASQVEQLARLIARSENAPLLGSYRALAQSPTMQGDPRVKLLLDSLVEIERERDSYNAVGGVDPVFVALTARANELGRNIEALAVLRRSALQRDLALLAPPAPTAPAAVAQRPLPDTMELMTRRDAARAAAGGVAARLARERGELQQLDLREARARELANVGASPSAMLAAALVFGAVLGFGFALFDEVRRPRIGDAYEAERATGVRVLGVIDPLPASPERGRRATDKSGPPYIDPGADGHQLIYLTIATAGSNTVMVTVTGDNPAVSAIVAVNFAAIAADEARATLLVDTDGASASVTAALHLRPSSGVKDVAAGSAQWPDVTRTARLGRERTIDVVTSGEGAASTEAIADVMQRDSARLARRYDAIVLVSAFEQVVAGLPAALPIPDVIYCARAGQTSLTDLKKAIADIREAGGHPRGIVLWSAPDPVLAEIRPVEEVPRQPAAVA
jgi:Mrp family chromosome partitioning ATPase